MAETLDPNRAPPLYRLVAGLLRPIVLRGLRPRVEGLHNVPADGPAILCGNHLSMLDPVIVPLLLSRPVVFLAKSEYFRFAPTRWFFDALGVVPVAREGGSAARASLERGTEVLRAGGLLSLYPEGTRSPDGRLYRGKTGPVRLALRAQAPIVPVGIIGTREMIPPHAYIPHFGVAVTVRFGEPLQFEGPVDDLEHLRLETDRLMRAIQQLSGQDYVDVYARPGHRARVSDDALEAFGERRRTDAPAGSDEGDRR
jgi:1-acyl-sn-glycerol-3-phosphate acyltransferase